MAIEILGCQLPLAHADRVSLDAFGEVVEVMLFALSRTAHDGGRVFDVSSCRWWVTDLDGPEPNRWLNCSGVTRPLPTPG